MLLNLRPFFFLQRSSSFKENNQPTAFKPYRPPGEEKKNCKVAARRSKLWRDTFDLDDMSPEEIKRQEAIFELFQGESDVVEDLNMAKQVGFDDN